MEIHASVPCDICAGVESSSRRHLLCKSSRPLERRMVSGPSSQLNSPLAKKIKLLYLFYWHKLSFTGIRNKLKNRGDSHFFSKL